MGKKLRRIADGIRFRVGVLICGIAITLVAAQLVTDTIFETGKSQQETVSKAQSITDEIALELQLYAGSLDAGELDRTLSKIALREELESLEVRGLSGETLSVFPKSYVVSSLEGADQGFLEAVEQFGPALHVSQNAILVTSPLVAGNNSNGSVIIRFENPDFWEVAKPIIVTNLSSSVPILLLGILLASMLARQITGPLSRLAASATEIANGNLDVLVPVEGPNEIKGLGRAVSAMIQTLKDNIDQIYQLAYVDRTTQLPNREYFRNELTRAIRRCVRQKSTGALLFIDLDGFKRVNDTHGHDAGDVLLGQFSDRLANVLRAEDLIGFDSFSQKETDSLEAGPSHEIDDRKKRQVLARLGGDEFTVLLSDIREATDAATVSKRIIDAVSEPFELDGTRVNIGASIGIAAFPQDGSDYQTILKSADMAMYQAKEEGKNTYRFFSAELNDAALRRIEIEADLRVALEAGNQLELYYQPKIDCATGLPNSAEALIRWNHPEKGMIQPLEFINIAEDCGLILPLGRWILEEACSQIVKFHEAGINISVGVNISTAQFERPDLAKIIREVLTQTGAPPSSLELELTESMAMQNPDVALQQIASLKDLGVRFAIDDFGTGYSNLSQLSRLPFDVFKIDRSIVDLIANTDDEHGRVIVRTILAMANSLDYETVAEGVETEEQYTFLTHHGCTSVQGYLFTRPLPVSDFVDWFAGWAKRENQLTTNQRRKIA